MVTRAGSMANCPAAGCGTESGSRLPAVQKVHTERAGLTLVEVVAGIGLLGTLLASLLISFSQQIRQQQRAQARLQAVQVLDRKLEEWYSGTDPIPVREEGELGSDEKLKWKTSRVKDAQAERWGMERVLIEIWPVEPAGSGPLVSLEVVQVPERGATEGRP